MNEFEASRKLSALVDEAMAALRKAEDFADEHKLEFSFSPAYGMGGWYNADPKEGDDYLGWNPSSQSC